MTRKARKLPKRNPRASKSVKTDPLDAMIDANARALGLNIDPHWKPSIRSHLQVILRHADFVQAAKLPDNAEPAPVFEA